MPCISPSNNSSPTTTHLGCSSILRAGDSATCLKLAYPDCVFVSRSIARKMSHARSRQTGSPVVRHMIYIDSIVCQEQVSLAPDIDRPPPPPKMPRKKDPPAGPPAIETWRRGTSKSFEETRAIRGTSSLPRGVRHTQRTFPVAPRVHPDVKLDATLPSVRTHFTAPSKQAATGHRPSPAVTSGHRPLPVLVIGAAIFGGRRRRSAAGPPEVKNEILYSFFTIFR